LAIRLPQSGTWGLACSLQRSGFRKTARLRNCSISAAPSPSRSVMSATGARPENGAARLQPSRCLASGLQRRLDLRQVACEAGLAGREPEARPLAGRPYLAGVADQGQRVCVGYLQSVHPLPELARGHGPGRQPTHSTGTLSAATSRSTQSFASSNVEHNCVAEARPGAVAARSAATTSSSSRRSIQANSLLPLSGTHFSIENSALKYRPDSELFSEVMTIFEHMRR